jgi:dihydropteroate synthase
MGILNRTPDSFYDQGKYHELELSLRRARDMIAEGADIIDVGGEKAGPGEPVSVEEEIERVAPAIRALKAETSVTISVDTFKPQVARAAVAAGADIVNGIGGMIDPAMRRVCADTGAVAVIMHIKGQPRVANPNPTYEDVFEEVYGFLEDRIAECIGDGIAVDRIIIDPGPAFGKTSEHDLEIIRHLDRLAELPYPLLLAVSRKRFIGDVLGLEADDRLEGSLAVAAWGVMRGARIIRTHDVKATRRVVDMTAAVLDPAYESLYNS